MSPPASDTRALRTEIEARGRERVEAIRTAAKARIAEMRAQERTRAEQRRRDALRGPDQELRRALARDLAQARIAGERRVLEARQALLDRVFAAAHAGLPEAFATRDARERLVARAREALRFAPEGEAVMLCSPGVAEILANRIDFPEDVRIETRPDLPVGFRVSAAGGALEIDGTLEQLLDQGRPALSIEVLHRLAEDAA